MKDTQYSANVEPSSKSGHQEEAKTADKKIDRQVVSAADQLATSSTAKRAEFPPTLAAFKARPTTRIAVKTDRQVTSIVDQVATSSIAKMADSTSILAAEPIKATSGAAVTTNSNPLKGNSLFGFAVVKRSNPSTAAVGKKPHADSNPANQPPNDTATAQAIRKIVDIPETASP